jgi:hypothetical protein
VFGKKKGGKTLFAQFPLQKFGSEETNNFSFVHLQASVFWFFNKKNREEKETKKKKEKNKDFFDDR